MAQIDIGKIKPVFRGSYDNSTAYVLDDIVYYNGSSYVAKTSTTGNLPTDTTKWNILASGSGGVWDSTLSIGTAGQIVKVNSGATALEFGDAPSGVIKKIHSFEKASRVTHNQNANTSAFTWTTGFVPLDPVNNKMIITGIVPVDGAGQNFCGYGLRFSKSGGSDYDFDGYGVQYASYSTFMGIQSYTFHLDANTFPAGTYTIYHRQYGGTGGSGVDSYFPNSTEDTRLSSQTRGYLIIQEYKN